MRKLVTLLSAAAMTVAVVMPGGSVAATPPTDVQIVVETDLLGGPSPFTASGSAVDDGLVCGAGVVFNATGKATGFSPTGFNFQGIKLFVCDDDSGEFFVNLQARIDFRRGDLFHWNVIRGTGDYTSLHGAGNGFGIPGVPCGDPNSCILDVYEGRVHID